MELAKTNKKLLIMMNYADSSVYMYNFPKELWIDYHTQEVKIKDKFDPKDIVLMTIMFLNGSEKEFYDKFNSNPLIIIPGPNLTAVSGKGASKQEGIEWISSTYHVSYKNMMVLGDSKNDVGMFSIPGVFSATYTGAKPYLQKMATLVVDKPKSVFVKEAVEAFEKYIDAHKVLPAKGE